MSISGKFDVHVKWNGRHIPKSPFRVEVGQDLDASQAYASGPGLEPQGIQAGKYTDFTVYTEGAGEGQVSVKVIDPRGGEDVDIIIEPQEDCKFFVEYQPVNTGKHTIKVMFGGQPISRSPFHVVVSPPFVEPIPSKVRVFGTGKVVNSCRDEAKEQLGRLIRYTQPAILDCTPLICALLKFHPTLRSLLGGEIHR